MNTGMGRILRVEHVSSAQSPSLRCGRRSHDLHRWLLKQPVAIGNDPSLFLACARFRLDAMAVDLVNHFTTFLPVATLKVTLRQPLPLLRTPCPSLASRMRRRVLIRSRGQRWVHSNARPSASPSAMNEKCNQEVTYERPLFPSRLVRVSDRALALAIVPFAARRKAVNQIWPTAGGARPRQKTRGWTRKR